MVDATSALAEATRQLEPISETARLDAELLLAHALDIERGAMLLRLRDLEAPHGFAALIERRLAQEPVAYILGVQHFWDLALDVSPAVLIPRADSETLIEATRDYFGVRQPARILDLGTGSGALLLAALSLFPDARGVGLDFSPAALNVASSNAVKLGFSDRAQFIEANWRDAGWSDALGQFDLILCNPPYVENNAPLAEQVRNFEPHLALFSGSDGLDDYRIIIPQIPALLYPNGVAIFEIGKDQDVDVAGLAANSRLKSRSHRDLAGIVRALSLVR